MTPSYNPEERIAELCQAHQSVTLLATQLRLELQEAEDALDRIQQIMSGEEWTPDTLCAIAQVVEMSGRPIKSPDI